MTIGQRRGMALGGSGAPRYAVDVDVSTATVTVGSAKELLVDETLVGELVWTGDRATGPDLTAQTSAHGMAESAEVVGGPNQWLVRWGRPRRRVAPGQSVVFYQGDEVVGGAIAC